MRLRARALVGLPRRPVGPEGAPVADGIPPLCRAAVNRCLRKRSLPLRTLEAPEVHRSQRLECTLFDDLDAPFDFGAGRTFGMDTLNDWAGTSCAIGQRRIILAAHTPYGAQPLRRTSQPLSVARCGHDGLGMECVRAIGAVVRCAGGYQRLRTLGWFLGSEESLLTSPPLTHTHPRTRAGSPRGFCPCTRSLWCVLSSSTASALSAPHSSTMPWCGVPQPGGDSLRWMRRTKGWRCCVCVCVSNRRSEVTAALWPPC